MLLKGKTWFQLLLNALAYKFLFNNWTAKYSNSNIKIWVQRPLNQESTDSSSYLLSQFIAAAYFSPQTRKKWVSLVSFLFWFSRPRSGACSIATTGIRMYAHPIYNLRFHLCTTKILSLFWTTHSLNEVVHSTHKHLLVGTNYGKFTIETIDN